MRKFTQLTLKVRYQISAYTKVGYTQIQIANTLGISQSTVSREIKRNSSEGIYKPELAEQFSFHRHKYKSKHLKLTRKVMNYIKDKLKLDWSPEQISGVMKLQKLSYVSHETIYQYIYKNKCHGGKLYLMLRHKNKKYHKRGNDYNSRGIIKNRVSIEKRPKVVEYKKRVGDFEIDTVIGKNHIGALVTIVDRATKFTLIKKVDSKKADVVTQALIDMLYPIKSNYSYNYF